MRKYLAFYRISIQNTLAYRGPILVWRIGNLLSLLTVAALWLSAEGGATIGGYRKPELITYYIFVMFLQWIVFWNASAYVGQEIKEGEFSTRALLKPASYYWQKFAHELGWHTLSPLYGLTIIALALFFLRTNLVFSLSPLTFFLLIIAILLGAVVCFSLSICLGLLAFWLTETSQINSLMWAGLLVLGGQGIPITFFSGFSKMVIYALPFRYVFSFPVEIFLGRLTLEGTLVSFAVQISWIVALVLLYNFLWKRGVKVYSSYGG